MKSDSESCTRDRVVLLTFIDLIDSHMFFQGRWHLGWLNFLEFVFYTRLVFFDEALA